MAEDWNYLAGRLVGDGTIEIVESDLPIKIDSLSRNLSAPSTMSGSISTALARLRNGGRPVFEPWNTVILAEASGLLRGMGIYRTPRWSDNEWSLSLVGLPGYAQGMPYDGSVSFVGEDPLNIFRHIWTHLQGFPAGNLGITVDPLASPIRVGTVAEDVQFTTGTGDSAAFEAGPRKLNWYTTNDLGNEIDSYAKETPFDWLEELSYLDGMPRCHIRLGYPTIGGRRPDLRLVLGENLVTQPEVTTDEAYNGIIVRGAGEGRDAIRANAAVTDGRIRRIKSIEDKKIKSVREAQAAAELNLASSRGDYLVETLEVEDHPNAPLEAIELGSEVQLYAETPWVNVDTWVRVVGRQDSTENTSRATLTVVRSAVA